MKKLMDFLDSLDFSVFYSIASVFGLAVVRLFLESLSSPEPTGLFAPFIGVISYASLYGLLLAMFAILMKAFSRKPMMWCVRVMTLAFPIVLITPVIDLALSGGGGYCIGYAQAEGKSLLTLIFHFLAPHESVCGITPGLRVQIIGGALGFGGVIWLATRSWAKSAGAAVAAYLVSFFGGVLPIIVNVITRATPQNTFEGDAVASLLGTIHYPTTSLPFATHVSTMTTLLLARIQLVLLFAAIGIIWYIASRESWKAWWKGFVAKLPVAGIHFALMIFGMSLGYSVARPTLIWPDWIGIVMILLAWTFASCSLGIENDLNDVAIDRVSNKEWWLINPGMKREHLIMIRNVAGVFAILCALTVNYNVAFCLGAFMTAYGMHSSGLRLKRFWPTASFLIVMTGCATFLAGFFTLSADQVVGNFPLAILGMVAFLILPYSIVKDVPDVAGDRIGNIHTMPAMFGERATLVVVLGLIVLWFALFWGVIPWFLAFGVIVGLIALIIKPKLARRKRWLFGIPTIGWVIALLVHVLFIL